MWVQRFLTVGMVTAGLAIPGAAQTTIKQLTVPAGPTSYLGVNLQEINADRAKALKLPEEAGVEITRVEANSPASAAGLQSGDVALEYNGQRVEGIEQFSRLVHETPAGREVKLRIFRSGASQTITAKIGMHSAAQQIAPVSQLFNNGVWPDSLQTFQSTWRSSALGMEAESLSGQLAEFFGVKEGVLVRSVMKDSAAEKAGVKAGDVITKVGDSKVSTPAEISTRMRGLRGQSIPLTLMRDHKETTVNVPSDGPALTLRPAERL
jgi:serine protease Do